MSRHRDVRCMNYSDEYDGYDDVYGHSVEDDYCVSPSAEQFMFDRSKQQNIASFITEPDIVEDNEDDNSISVPGNKKLNLSEIERSKLLSCMETIKHIIGDSIPESKLEEEIIQSGFDAEVVSERYLKELPHKNINEPSRGSKDCSDICPGSTSSFVIPKLSLSQKLKIPSCTKTTTSIQGQINKSESTFSSLADMIASHTNSKMVTQCKPIPSSFGSLADLTAHHLQKSNSPTSNIEFCKKSSPSSGFIIPKLNINNDKEHGTASSDSEIKNCVDERTNIANNVNKDKFNVCKDQIDSIQKGISNFKLASDSNNEFEKEKSANLRNLAEHNVKTSSPENWLIDLSAALKEVYVPDSKIDQMKPITSTYHDTLPYMDICDNDSISDSDSEMNIKCTLNLNSLRCAKLPYIKERGSSLGRILSRKWKLKKPFINYKTQECRTIKRFDFSTPYTRS